MKYLLRTNIDKVTTTTSEGENTVYGVQGFKRDKTDLEFMTLGNLQRWYIEEYEGTVLYDEDSTERKKLIAISKYIEKNPSLKDKEHLVEAYLENGDKSIVYGIEKVSYDTFKALRSAYNSIVEVVGMPKEKTAGGLGYRNMKNVSPDGVYYINNELKFLFSLDRDGIQYEIN